MVTAFDLYRQGRQDEIWRKYCGFIDLKLDEFMHIQKRLLLEQLQLLSNSEIGLHLLREVMPRSIEEFREVVPFTTYADYAPYFEARREDILPVKPRWWLHTSGRSGEYKFKWVPYTPQMVKKLGETVLALFIFASCSGRGRFPFEEGDRMLYTMAPFPYMSGGVARAVMEEFPFRFLPPLEEAERMEFEERVEKGLLMALREGMEAFNAIAVVLVKIGERFSQGASRMTLSPALLHPKVLFRLLRGMVRARLHGRTSLLPKDLWSVKGVATGGTDTQVFRDKIREMWGKEPIEAYGCTEGGVFALQLWNGKGMTMMPDLDFLEFMPMEEYEKNQADPTYQPRTLLLDEVEAGEIYEVIITNFLGGVYTRYRTGDFLQVISLEDEETDVHLPQWVFYSKSRDVIDLGSFSRLTERTIWEALERSGVAYTDWVAVKTYEHDSPVLNLYIEFQDESLKLAEAQRRIHLSLSELDRPYADLEEMLGVHPLRITPLAPGAFRRYYDIQQKHGADLAHLKPPHMNPSDAQLALLVNPQAYA